MATNPSLLVFGFGYTAAALAARLPWSWRIAGTRRAARGDGPRVSLLAFDGTAMPRSVTAAIAAATHILVSVPPDEDGDPVLRHAAAAIAAAPNLTWLGYLSTTGVYGDHSGAWADEATPPAPSGPRGARRVAAETGWCDLWHDHGVPVHLFRLPGIYGPGRSAIDTVRAGTARCIVKPGHVFSRIHVADIATALWASMTAPRPGTAYNVCDDDPAPPQDVVAFACRLLGVPVPPAQDFAGADLSPMARSFYADNKRVANVRLKRDLGVRLAYPDYRAGLTAVHRAAYFAD